FKSGKFTEQETERIRTAVREYAEANNISVLRLCEEAQHKGDIKGAWVRIAEAIPDRTVQSIYRHAIRQMHTMKKGHWTPEETQQLVRLVHEKGPKWRLIEKEVGRFADACRDKYREVAGAEFQQVGQWSPEDDKKLVAFVRAACSVPEATPLESWPPGLNIPWSNVSRQMGTRSRLSCTRRWNSLAGKVRAAGGS
ncbi:unnamed protein product, partial [Phaeothamnion confervicola]